MADERSVVTADESGEEGAEEDDQEDVPDRDQARILAHSRRLSFFRLLSIFPLLSSLLNPTLPRSLLPHCHLCRLPI